MKLTRDEVLALMEKMVGKVSAITMRTIRRIINLAMGHQLLGESFSFDMDGKLDEQVDNLLIEMSDAVIREIEGAVKDIVDEDDAEKVLLYIRRLIDGKDLTERMDQHASNLKTILEAYIALCLTGSKNRADAIAGALSYITANKGGFGRGMNGNPIMGMTVLAQTEIDMGFIRGSLLGFERDGAVGYQVFRGSNYQCQDCDDVCFGPNGKRRLYSFQEDIPIPVHPNCVCYALPVYAEDLISLL